MKRQTGMLLPLVAFAALGAVSVYLIRHAQSASDAAPENVVQASVPQETTMPVSQEIAEPQAAAQTPEPGIGEKPAQPPVASSAAVSGPSPGEADTATPMARLGQAMVGVMNDPNLRQMVSASQRLGVRMAYGDLTKELQLTQDQVILDGQAKVFERVRNAGGDPTAFASATRDVKAETDAAMLALLGNEKFLKYEAYQKTVPERMEVSRLSRQLSAANAPLSDSQRKQLLAALSEERALLPAAGQGPGAFMPGTPEQQRWQSDYDTRVRERASRILTADQMKQFEQMQSQQNAVRNMIGALMPGMGSPQGGTPR
jgi:hypothetical protein